MVTGIEESVSCLLRYLMMREQCSVDCMRRIILQAEKGRTVIHPVEERRDGPCEKWG